MLLHKRTSAMGTGQQRTPAATAVDLVINRKPSQNRRRSNAGTGAAVWAPRRTTVDKLAGPQQSRLRRLQHSAIPANDAPSHRAAGTGAVRPGVSCQAQKGDDANRSAGHWALAIKEVSLVSPRPIGPYSSILPVIYFVYEVNEGRAQQHVW